MLVGTRQGKLVVTPRLQLPQLRTQALTRVLRNRGLRRAFTLRSGRRIYRGACWRSSARVVIDGLILVHSVHHRGTRTSDCVRGAVSLPLGRQLPRGSAREVGRAQFGASDKVSIYM